MQEKNVVVEYEYSVLRQTSGSDPRRQMNDSNRTSRERVPASHVRSDDVSDDANNDVAGNGDQADVELNNSDARLTTFADQFIWRASSWTRCSVSCGRGHLSHR